MALEKYEHHFPPEELVGFIYAVLHAPTSGAKYAEFLCAPVCGTSFRSLSEESGAFRDRRRMPPRGMVVGKYYDFPHGPKPNEE
jgi:hypothetical protein